MKEHFATSGRIMPGIRRFFHFAFTRTFALLLGAILSFLLLLWASSDIASAAMRNSDILAGKTVGQRTLTLAQQVDIEAPYACLIDSTGLIYFEREAHTPAKIASITKVMTALVALEHGVLTDTLTVSRTAATVGESSAYLREGDQLTFRAALAAMLVPSGNDASVAIAEYIGTMALEKHWNLGLAEGEEKPTDALQAFVCLMNLKAKDLQLEDTLFTNPHGLDDGYYEGDQHSTAYDVARFVKEAMTYDTFREIVASSGGSVKIIRNGEEMDLKLSSTDWFIETYDYAIGVKTGSTDYAGYCFAGAASYNDLEVYSVVLGCSSDTERFSDSSTLCNWAFSHYTVFNFVSSPESVTYTLDEKEVTSPLFAEVAHNSWVDRTYKTVLSLTETFIPVFDIDGNVCQKVNLYDIQGDISVGDKVGYVSYIQKNEIIYEADIIAAENSKAPNMFQTIGVWWQRLINSFSGKPTVALTHVYNKAERIIDREAY